MFLQIAADKWCGVVATVVYYYDFVVLVCLVLETLGEFIDVFTFVLSWNKNRDERILGKEQLSCYSLFPASFAVVELKPDDDDELKQIVAWKLYEEEEPICT